MSETPHAAVGEYGFSMIELAIVVVILGVLVAVAMPVFWATTANSETKTCFANQRTIEGAIPTWEAADPGDNTLAGLAGTLDASSPLVADRILARAPRCTSAPYPADPGNPSAAEGAYQLNANGDVMPCTFGRMGPHGHFD